MTEVCVYKNLKNGMWSVTSVKGNGNRGPLLFHAHELVLTECRAVVKESRRKVIESGGHREVCAWFVGELVLDESGLSREEFSDSRRPARVTFRPRERGEFFRTDTGDPVLEADAIFFDAAGAAWLL